MLKNYFLVALRALRRHRIFAFINISGLVLGLTTFLLIATYVIDELSYDNFHEKKARIFRLEEMLHLPKETIHQVVTSPPMAPTLQGAFAEIEKTVRLTPGSGVVSYEDKTFFEARLWYCDSALFDIFTFQPISGDLSTALTKPYSI